MVMDRLIEKIKECNNPTVVGLDPKIDFIPEFILKKAFKKHGKTPKAVAKAFYEFNKKIIDQVYDLVPAVKPQIAMFEQYGYHGIKAYIETINHAKKRGLIVIGDVKRGDIQSTAESYSDGHIGIVKIGRKNYSIFNEDIITVNPYLGSDSITPYLDNCKKFGKGLFVLVKTSNPHSGDIQDLVTDGRRQNLLDADGEKVYEKVGLMVSDWGSELIGKHGFSSVGAVVGATYKEEAKRLRELLPHVFFLIPGYGAQGGKAEDLVDYFNKDKLGGIVNSSRGIIACYKTDKYRKDFSEKEFAKASRQAVIDMRDDIMNALNRSNLDRSN